jgi:ribosome-associated protein
LEKLSRTKKKKAAEGLQKMGEDLIALDDAQLEALDLPPDLKTAICEARSFKSHGAYRRQLQYIGRLMRNYDTEIIEQALQKMAAKDDEKKRWFKIVERWRDELVGGDTARLDWLLTNHPAIDQQQLNHLVNCARGVTAQMNAKEAARKLFRFLSRLEAETDSR